MLVPVFIIYNIEKKKHNSIRKQEEEEKHFLHVQYGKIIITSSFYSFARFFLVLVRLVRIIIIIEMHYKYDENE